MPSCEVSACDDPQHCVLGGVALCLRHYQSFFYSLEVQIRFQRHPFHCSAETLEGTACQREGQRVDGLPDFIRLCPRHRNDLHGWRRWQREDELERAVEQMKAKEAEQRKRSVVYFVERDGFVKIGTTIDLRSRLRALARGGQMPEGMTVGPVTVLATMPGDRGNEGFLHGRFAEQRIPRTEWFYPAPELLDFIAGLRGRTPEFERFRRRHTGRLAIAA